MRKLTLIIASLLCYVGVLHAEALVKDGVYTIEGGAQNQHRGYLAAGKDYAVYPVLSNIGWGSYADNGTEAIDNGEYWYVQCANKSSNTYYIYNIALNKFLDGNNNQVNFGDAPYAWEIVSNPQGGIDYTSIKNVSFACGSKPRNVNYHWEPSDGGSMHTIKAVDNATDYAEQVATAKFKIMLSTATAIENVSDISNEQAYVFYTVRSPLYCNEAGSVAGYWTNENMPQQGNKFDVAQENQQFALLRTENTEDGKYYLYSVASGKFIDGKNNATETPVAAVTLEPTTRSGQNCFVMSLAGEKVNVTHWQATNGIRLYSEGITTDEGNALRVYLAEGNYDLSAALAAIQDVETPDVAKIDETKYATLAAAVEAAQAGDEIVIIADIELAEAVTIPAGKKITLNLNGKTVVATDNATGSYAMITNQGDLTITGNGTMTLTATNDRDWNAYSSVISNTVGGKLTVNGGTIEHLGGTDMAYAIDNLTNGKGTYAETVINGGTIKSTYRAIRQFLNGVEAQNILTVNGGTIEGANKSIWMQDPSKNANTGTLTVAAGAKLTGDVYLFVTAGSTEWPVSVSIAAAALQGESKVVTGNVPAQYVVENVNGTFGVAVDPAYGKEAFIGETYYATLAAAVEAAQAGDEIVIIADIADVTVDVTKNLTISGAATLNNVGINANGADALTVEGLTFTGNSWINSGTAEALTVSGITATVAPNNTSYTNSRSAFISLGRSEGQELALTVENNNITVKAAGSDAILGWAKITAATITGNVIKGSNDGYFTNADAIKFMSIADGAEFVVNSNEIYSNYNGIVFAQNTTRDNAYSVSADANKFYGGADHIWIEITGGNTVHATFNATSANTVNGNAFTVADISFG